MSMLPPTPPKTSGTNNLRLPNSSNTTGKATASRINLEDIEKASFLPLLCGVIALLTSLGIWIINRHSSLLLSFAGYVLCPLIIIVSLGLDSYLQRIKTSQGKWFVPNQNYGQILRVLSVVGIIFSYPHISGLADHISAWLAQVFPWMAS